MPDDKRQATDDTISVPEASRRLGVSARTIQRREDVLREVGSIKTGAGWRIPADQVDKLASIITTPRHATRDTPPATASRRHASLETRQATQEAHDACRERETELRVELAEARATITELRAQVDDLLTTKTALLEQNASATAANAAMAMSLRENLTRIENTYHEDTSTPRATNEAPHQGGAGLRSRLSRIFDSSKK